MKSLALVAPLSLGAVLAWRSPAAPREEPGLADLSWLAGHWSSEGNGTVTEELWMAPAGGLMPGINRVVPAKGRASFEFLRIEEHADGIVYVASPGGKAATSFPLADLADDFVLFENLEHDFPQHIRYQRRGENQVEVRAWAEDEASGLAWTWTRR